MYVSRALIRTLKLSIAEMGGRPFWMGPLSSMYMDGKGNVNQLLSENW